MDHVIFKRTKAKPAVRTRPTSPEPTKDQEDPEDAPITLATKIKNKVKKSRPKSKLSFGDEEEEGDGEVFQVKKSSLSRKLALGKNAAAMSLDFESTVVAQNRGPTYDDAYLKELKASTPNARHIVTPAGDDMSVDISETAFQTLDVITETGETSIPSESSIKVAKERRERVRKAKISGDDDYISLAVTRRDDNVHPESRLVREEDELGEVEEEFAEYTSAQERIALGKKSRKREAARKRDEMRDLIDEAAEEDEETQEWEQEQLRRGGHRTPEQDQAAKIKPTYKPAPIPAMTQIPILGPAIGRLTQQLAELTTSYRNDTASLTAFAKEKEDVIEKEKEMRVMVEKAEEKRAWFSDFKDWIEGVANFFDVKYPLLEKLEDEHVSLLQERFDMIQERRRADDDDDLSILLGPLPESDRTQETSHGTDDSAPAPLSKRERRLARIARRQLRQQRQKADEEEGYSTDSSLPPLDAVAYDDALKSLASKKKDILSDVKVEEFHKPSEVRWSVWRDKYTDSYVGAWGGLGVISVWEFWARLEMVGWDCVETPKSLDSFKWYKAIYEYSRLGNDDTQVEERDLGPDGDLVSSMVSTAVIPRLCKLIDGGALDVYSAKHVRRVIDLAEEVEASVEDGNAKLQILLRSTARAAPAFDPETIPARRRFLAKHVKLLQNLMTWRKHTGERFGIGALATRLVDSCIVDFAQDGWEVGGDEFARRVASILSIELLPARLRSTH
ncbi:hypothetical protein AX14_004859 [Amanita brunnescens Koide BX004]|nr:hypothetical protein AX14_007877 [Amanita brunnescens Koide BX004]KAF8731456.1 hypothetical protein AX14_004859 [Amanita brunnescens Koide BX004]